MSGSSERPILQGEGIAGAEFGTGADSEPMPSTTMGIVIVPLTDEATQRRPFLGMDLFDPNLVFQPGFTVDIGSTGFLPPNSPWELTGPLPIKVEEVGRGFSAKLPGFERIFGVYEHSLPYAIQAFGEVLADYGGRFEKEGLKSAKTQRERAMYRKIGTMLKPKEAPRN